MIGPACLYTRHTECVTEKCECDCHMYGCELTELEKCELYKFLCKQFISHDDTNGYNGEVIHGILKKLCEVPI